LVLAIHEVLEKYDGDHPEEEPPSADMRARLGG